MGLGQPEQGGVVPLVLIGTLVIFTLACAVTWLYAAHARRQGLLDRPNERSSHTLPTPRGGGVAIVAASMLAWFAMWQMRSMEPRLVVALLGGGLAVAAIGFLDDRGGVPARIRLLIHVAAAAWAVAWLGGLPPLQVGDSVVDLGWLGHILAVGGIALALNLFNFMDGIDGLAASEAVFVCFALAALGLVSDLGPAAAVAWTVGAASAGFLVWNWPPARIFMGDVGSGYLGYVLAVLPLALGKDAPHALFVWIILVGCFAADAVVTLVRRVARGERVHEAHRKHAYQRFARRHGHKAVTLALQTVNVLWLLPAAAVAHVYPTQAAWLALGAVAPLFVAAALLGAGARD